MKRLLISLFLSCLFLSSQAVTIVVERLTGTVEKCEQVRSIVFSPNKITCTLYGNTTTTIDSVRTLTFGDVVFTAIENTPATSTLRVYPNPTASMLVIEGATGNGTMDVYNINGTLLLSEPIQEGVNTIQVSNLAKGLYILKLPNDTFKFTKQ